MQKRKYLSIDINNKYINKEKKWFISGRTSFGKPTPGGLGESDPFNLD